MLVCLKVDQDGVYQISGIAFDQRYEVLQKALRDFTSICTFVQNFVGKKRFFLFQKQIGISWRNL